MAIVAKAAATRPPLEVRQKLTPDDVWHMVDRGELKDGLGYELVEGELIEVPPAFGEHGRRSVNVAGPLWVFAREKGGRVYDSSTGFVVGRDRQQLRSPDVAYLAREHVGPDARGFIHGAPDLAVEVLSQGQHGQAYAQNKLQDYFDAGAQLVWFVDIQGQEVRVYRPNANEYTTMRDEAVLTLEPVVSGFALRVADIFRD